MQRRERALQLRRRRFGSLAPGFGLMRCLLALVCGRAQGFQLSLDLGSAADRIVPLGLSLLTGGLLPRCVGFQPGDELTLRVGLLLRLGATAGRLALGSRAQGFQLALCFRCSSLDLLAPRLGGTPGGLFAGDICLQAFSRFALNVGFLTRSLPSLRRLAQCGELALRLSSQPNRILTTRLSRVPRGLLGENVGLGK